MVEPQVNRSQPRGGKMKYIFLICTLLFALSSQAKAELSTGGKVFSGAVTHDTQTISTSVVTLLAANDTRKFLQIQNVGAANNLACTLDGSTPVISGNGVQLGINGSVTYDAFVPTGTIKCIGSASGTILTVTYK